MVHGREEDAFDPVLEERVREAMGKPEGDISAADAAAVTTLILNAPEGATDDQRIRDISALWYFMNLEELEFMSNAVTDISPLSPWISMSLAFWSR